MSWSYLDTKIDSSSKHYLIIDIPFGPPIMLVQTSEHGLGKQNRGSICVSRPAHKRQLLVLSMMGNYYTFFSSKKWNLIATNMGQYIGKSFINSKHPFMYIFRLADQINVKDITACKNAFY